MQNDEIEWDDAKAASNLRDHGVTFELACIAFSDAFGVEFVDDGQLGAEARFVLLGMVDDRLLFVSHTMRAQRTRIISARKASAIERGRYHAENRQP